MTARLSEGLVPPTWVFGLSTPKYEGSSVHYLGTIDSSGEGEETFWIERSFTKEQFAVLSQLLRRQEAVWLQELGLDCQSLADQGLGGNR